MPYHGSAHSNAENDNHANQMNPNNDAYWDSRDFEDRPDDWDDRIGEEEADHKNHK